MPELADTDDAAEATAKIQASIEGSIRKMEALLLKGGTPIHTTLPHDGVLTEGQRRFNVMCVLHACESEIPPAVTRALLFDEDLEEHDLMLGQAESIEMALQGIRLLALGNSWGANLSQIGLKQLDGQKINLTQSTIARGVENVLEKFGTMRNTGVPSAPSDE